MRALWKLDRAFVKEILAEWEGAVPPVTTVSSIVRKLEQEGFIGHETFGKTHRYFPKVSLEAYRQNSLKQLVSHFFEGSPKALLSHFVREEQIDPEELNDLIESLKHKG